MRRRDVNEVEVLHEHGVVKVALTQGLYAVVDVADYPMAAPYIWHAEKHGHTWYAVSSVGYLHHFIMKPPAGLETDHRDGSGLNDTRMNLRNVTHAENMKNNRKARLIQRMMEESASQYDSVGQPSQ